MYLRSAKYFTTLPSDVVEKTTRLDGNINKYFKALSCIYSTVGSEFGEVSSKLLRKATGKDYDSILSQLEFAGIIRSDGHYKNQQSKNWKGKSKCISFGINSDFKSFTDVTIHGHHRIEPFESENLVGVARVCLTNLKDFKIDLCAAMSHLESRQRSEIKGKSPLGKTEYSKARQDLIKIANGQYYSVMDKYNRIHTNFTSLPKWIKKNCLYHVSGQQLVQIDIVSSQPNILRMILGRELDMSTPEVKAEFDLFTNFCETDLYRCLFLVYMASKNFELFDNEHSETCKSFKEAFKNELFEKLSRDDYKLEILKSLFDSDSQGEPKKKIILDDGTYFFKRDESSFFWELYRSFEKLFPNIYRFIQDYKKEEFRELARDLQKWEGIALHSLIAEIKKCNVSFFTVHDSVITTKEHRDLVHEKFKQILINMGVLPNLDIEYF